MGETVRLLKIVPRQDQAVHTGLAHRREVHVCGADALQVVSARHVSAGELYTEDKQVHEVALKEESQQHVTWARCVERLERG